MSEDIKKIGQIFKEKRNEMNLSIKEVENATSILSSNLEAIERGEVDKFLSSVYAIGFMKQYANFLGLDAEKILHDHPEVFRLPEENHEFNYGIGTLEVRGSQGGGVKWFPNLLWIGASAVVLFLAYLFAKQMGVL
ncbi:MAG: helix-turn-helix domain-containing protein [Candidatus Algichlamydia australiensis]|nr:helix-turn-helix domain-containing protein [Chlamydiales bacterium]